MIKTIEYINTYATCNFPLVSGYYKMLHTCDGDLLLSGISKHPLNFPHSFSPTSGVRQSMCLTKPQGVSQMNSNGGYFNERNKSAASRTDSCKARHLEMTVIYMNKKI